MTRAPALPVLALALLSAPAYADDVTAAVKGKVPVGQQPSLTITAHKDVRRATLEVRSSKGKHRQSLGPVKEGGTLEFKLPHKKPGKLEWTGQLQVSFTDGATGSMPVRFASEVLSAIKFQVTNDQQDIQTNQRVIVEADAPVKKVSVEVYGEDDVLLASRSVAFDMPAAGTPLTVDWVPGKEGPVLRINVAVHDEADYRYTAQFFPFVISIPHEEVVFDSGKSDVLPSEEAKLRAALAEMTVTVKRYAKGVAVGGGEMRLFVSGFTDTVGPSGANRTLSQQRARAIGAWFKSHGVGIPVYVRGFGEDVLKVQTADETDEVRNRRADYDISVDGPTGSLSGWTRL